MKTRNETSAGRAIGTARVVAIGAALALLAGCGDDDASTAEEGVVEGAVPPSSAPADDPGTGDGGGATAGPEPTIASGADPGLDDREGLAVEIDPDASTVSLGSDLHVFIDLFGLASRPFDGGDARAALNRFESPVPFERYVEVYTRELDACTVRDIDAPDGDGGAEDEGDPAHVDGGEALTISTPSGTFGEIPRVLEPNDVFYDADYALPGPVPSGASLSIPGADFPAVDAYPLVRPAPPVRLEPAADAPPSRSTVYRWVPDDLRTRFKVVFLAHDPDDGSFRGYPVSCHARDDGEFTVTAEAADALETSPYTLTTRMARVARLVELRDGIVFYTTAEITE